MEKKPEVSDYVENNLIQKNRQMKIHWKKREIAEEVREHKLKTRDYKKLLTKACLSSIHYDTIYLGTLHRENHQEGDT